MTPSERVGSLAAHWKGGRVILKTGYIQIRKGKRYVFEHRLVMESHLGRKLLPMEMVHHRNGIRHDNRIENLVVLSQSEHMSHHNPRILLPRPCARCGHLIERPRTLTIPKYCSKRCSNLSYQRGKSLTCLTCKKLFHRKPYMVMRATHHFCSVKCKTLYKKSCHICGTIAHYVSDQHGCRRCYRRIWTRKHRAPKKLALPLR